MHNQLKKSQIQHIPWRLTIQSKNAEINVNQQLIIPGLQILQCTSGFLKMIQNAIVCQIIH